MPPKAAPVAPVTCSHPTCDYSTPADADLATALQFLTLHVQTAHPIAPGPVNQLQRPITKVETRSRPEVTMDTTEADWRFFISEWDDYKRVTGITGQSILDELWSCMKGDLKRLAFDQGGKETLTTEVLMIARIKSLAVTELHSAVHTISLHEAKQAKEESTKAFAARVQGIAASCNLTKPCTCGIAVSFTDETVYHVVLAGLRDPEMQERCLAAAYLKSVTNLPQLIQFCSAEESSKSGNNALVGALKSRYQKEKRAAHISTSQQPTFPKPAIKPANQTYTCMGCDGYPHWKNKSECPAFKVICAKCGKSGHFTSLCRTATVAAVEEAKETYAFALDEEDKAYEAAAVEEREKDYGSDDACNFAYI